ncbi:DNA polymerase III subunit delta [Acidaminobacter sp. JC074]|uniref:DNA polymerase III subunit delta n=1 Tax=Acidaminobacter sp. JC074 TaxID=2530199 RepID=UPI001F10EFC5|nr:DNA polymerase III subunit delta [Acidaminobacter sp. JC074]MCH4887742.1 DNA polymerase III subunit delta [Acidaminobacter sp. JC074]
MGFEVFDNDIKNGLKPLYLFYGQERYLIDQFVDKMIDKYVPDAYRDFNLVVFDGDKSDVDEILDACETVPFFNEVKIVIVKNATFFRSKKANLSDAHEKRLLEYFSTPLESTKLFFISNQAIDKRKKITKDIGKNGRVVEYGKLDAGIFSKWMHKKIKSYKKDIDRRNLAYLVDRMAYLDKQSSKTLLDVDNEIRMICSSMIDRKNVETDDIDKYVKKPLDSDIFHMVDAVGQKKAETAISIMHEILRKGEPIQVIFSMVCRQFRMLKKIKMLADEGYNQATIAKLLGAHPYAVKSIMRQIHRFDSKTLTKILTKCSDLDYKMKSTAIDSVLAVETLIIECSYQI